MSRTRTSPTTSTGGMKDSNRTVAQYLSQLMEAGRVNSVQVTGGKVYRVADHKPCKKCLLHRRK